MPAVRCRHMTEVALYGYDTASVLLCCAVLWCVQIYLQMVVQQHGIQPGICRRGERPPPTVGTLIALLMAHPSHHKYGQQLQ